jgi:hypothetical protein
MWDLQDVSSDLLCEARNSERRTELTKSALIVGAFDPPLFWVGIQTLVASRAISILGKPPTLWHAPEVVLVEKLTSVPFLTEASEPVFTYGGKPLPVSRMSWQLLWRLEV